jgi:hypothetical protein
VPVGDPLEAALTTAVSVEVWIGVMDVGFAPRAINVPCLPIVRLALFEAAT